MANLKRALRRVTKSLLQISTMSHLWESVALKWHLPRAYRRAIMSPTVPGKTVFIDSVNAAFPLRTLYEQLNADFAVDTHYTQVHWGHPPSPHEYDVMTSMVKQAATAQYVLVSPQISSKIHTLVTKLSQISTRPSDRQFIFLNDTTTGDSGLDINTLWGVDLSAHSRVSALSILNKQAPQGKDISIIIPAYNAMPELTRTLQSIVDQTYPLERIEAIVVDDGSTDDTWKEIQHFTAEYPQVFVGIRRDKGSGGPAVPRNNALDKATGEYIFCLDADDWFGPQAIERALNHALQWNSDVLYVKMVGAGGRAAPVSMFQQNAEKVDLFSSKVLWSLSPLKLFRRSMIEAGKIRFFEEGMPEDQHFVLQALLDAQTISVAADYDYYYWSWRDEREQNVCHTLYLNLDKNLAAFTALRTIIDQRISKKDRDRALTKRLSRHPLSMFRSLVRNYPEDQWESYGQRITDLFESYYDKAVGAWMKQQDRIELEAGFSGNYDLLKAQALKN